MIINLKEYENKQKELQAIVKENEEILKRVHEIGWQFSNVNELNHTVNYFIKANKHKLSENAIKVLKLISRYSVKHKGISWLRKETIAKELNIHERTVRNSFKTLTEIGAITVLDPERRVKGGKNKGKKQAPIVIINRGNGIKYARTLEELKKGVTPVAPHPAETPGIDDMIPPVEDYANTFEPDYEYPSELTSELISESTLEDTSIMVKDIPASEEPSESTQESATVEVKPDKCMPLKPSEDASESTLENTPEQASEEVPEIAKKDIEERQEESTLKSRKNTPEVPLNGSELDENNKVPRVENIEIPQEVSKKVETTEKAEKPVSKLTQKDSKGVRNKTKEILQKVLKRKDKNKINNNLRNKNEFSLDHTFLIGSSVPEEFILAVKPFFNNAEEIYHLWRKVTLAGSKYAPDIPSYTETGIKAFKQTVFAMKRDKISKDYKGYFYGTLKNMLTVEQRKYASMSEENGYLFYDWLSQVE